MFWTSAVFLRTNYTTVRTPTGTGIYTVYIYHLQSTVDLHTYVLCIQQLYTVPGTVHCMYIQYKYFSMHYVRTVYCVVYIYIRIRL
jgi:hypothetical protein